MSQRIKKIRILLTGGGTGGHIYPLAAVAEELQKQINERGSLADIRYFGSAFDFAPVLERAGVKLTHITSSKWRRYASIGNFFDIFRFFFGLIQSLWKVFWFMPHASFSKGGPGSFAVILACRFYFTPIVIHESDAIAGFANRLAQKPARLIELSFESAKEFFPNKETHLVGNPVRREIVNPIDSKLAKEQFGLNPAQATILFLCGSQGAEKVNNFVLENIEALGSRFQILHQTGPKNFSSYKQQYDSIAKALDPSLAARYQFFPYFENNLNAAYGAADLAVARAGSGIIFELAAQGKPAILIPISESANNHQWQNAYVYSKTGAAVVIEEENLLASVFISQAEKILKDGWLFRKMSESAKKFYIPDSAKLIAQDILGILLK